MPETTWPEGVVGRYLTVGGATVDLTHRLNTHTPPMPIATLALCTGCPALAEISHWTTQRGTLATWEEHTPTAADEAARDWAQGHAAICRALPRPTA